jgi:hypothetical protein
MKDCSIHLISLLILCLIPIACDENTACVNDSEEDKCLIENSSFEYFREPSLEGWGAPYPNTITFINDAPIIGGNWSVEIKPDLYPRQVYFIWYFIAALEGTHRYNFSFWAKGRAPNSYAKILIKHSQSYITKRSINVYTSKWLRYSVIDTLSTEIGDTIIVKLEGGSVFGLVEKAKYDRVMLYIID